MEQPVAGGHITVRSLLAAAQRLPFGERCRRVRIGQPPQFDRFPRLPLAGHVFSLLQSVRLLLAQREFPRRSQNLRPAVFAQRLAGPQRSQTAAQHRHAQHDGRPSRPRSVATSPFILMCTKLSPSPEFTLESTSNTGFSTRLPPPHPHSIDSVQFIDQPFLPTAEQQQIPRIDEATSLVL